MVEKSHQVSKLYIHRCEREGYRFNNWAQIYKLPYKCTASTRSQSLHFRIVHRYVPTLKFLHTRQIIESPLCPKCGIDESLSHFLFYCQDVKPLWDIILSKLKQLFRLNNAFVSCKTVLFGYSKATPIVNLILLLVKQYIIICKARETRSVLRVEGLKQSVLRHFEIEKYTAKCSSIEDAFQLKWERVLGENGSLILESFI